MTPKQYATRHQVQRFRDNLRTSPSVTDAIHDSDFSSSSRAYDNSRGRLGMTPTAYRRGAAGLTLRYEMAPCSLGWIVAARSERGICAIEFGDDPASLQAQLRDHFPEAQLEEAGPEFASLFHQVVDLVETPEKDIDLPLDIQGTAFQERVWHALQTVPAGTTVSYGELAERIGQPSAARAVAQACAANKLAVAVPCHRVVRNDGALGGYRWGVERKRRLLRREAGVTEKSGPQLAST